jgi:ABC-type transporter Mla maintaining outer membrane lipid asymmetry ATPase subunit MlaF
MLKEGRVIFHGTDEELWMSKDPYIKDFFKV